MLSVTLLVGSMLCCQNSKYLARYLTQARHKQTVLLTRVLPQYLTGLWLGVRLVWRVMSFVCVCVVTLQLVMQTATAGGRPSVKPTSTSSGGGEGRKAASAAAAAGEGSETLEHLSATALLQLIKLADATQQLAPLFAKLPLADGSTREAAPGSSSSNASDAAAEVATAVMPVLPQLLSCTDSLLQQGCFKEAQVRADP
jgi:hypothetical protein